MGDRNDKPDRTKGDEVIFDGVTGMSRPPGNSYSPPPTIYRKEKRPQDEEHAC